MAIDLVIRDVRVLDGNGGEAVEGDVGVDGERIVSIGPSGSAGSGTREIDGRGRVLAPGMVDVHSHDDGALLRHPDMAFKLAQGCTTVVIGNCGFSAIPAGNAASASLLGLDDVPWIDLDGFAVAVEEAAPAVNAVALVGHNSVRSLVMGDDRGEPDAAQLDAMKALVGDAMAQGACGFSSGLIYHPGRWAKTEEIATLAAEARPYGGIYATHMRNEGDHLLESVDEALLISKTADVPLQISHHKAAGEANWGKIVESLARVHAAADAGQDVTLDVYPYVAGSGPMWQYFDAENPDPEYSKVIRIARCPDYPEFEGRMVVDIAEDESAKRNEPIRPHDIVRQILTAPQARAVICIQFIIDEDDIETNLRDPLMMVGSDGIPDLVGSPHPRLFGTFPRVLGHYVRNRGVLPLAEAIRRMTSMSADRFGLADRGRIVEGAYADLVVFDPDTVIDTATFDDPKQEPTGIDLVVVNGAVALDHGTHTGSGTGRLLRYRQS
ncbi:MAG: D-aminoacylase [Actinomycetia bacterium]|nr:D-aminoacylase [Actinomycetes bacterium]